MLGREEKGAHIQREKDTYLKNLQNKGFSAITSLGGGGRRILCAC